MAQTIHERLFRDCMTPDKFREGGSSGLEHSVNEINKTSSCKAVANREAEVMGKADSAAFPHVEECVHRLVTLQSTANPLSDALVSEKSTLSFRELEELSSDLSLHFLDSGCINKNDNVGHCFEKSEIAVVCMLAILKCGAACVPLDPEHPPARTSSIISTASLRTVMTDFEYSWTQGISHVVVNWSYLRTSSKRHRANGASSLQNISLVGPSDNAFILFTSGSTGSPKGVVLKHSAICSSAYYHGRPMYVSQGTRVYQHAAYTFDMSIYDIFTTLILGGTVCIPSNHDRTHGIAESIRRLGANWAFFTPTLLSTLHPTEVPTLKTILLAGESVTQEIVDLWADRVCLLNGYGSTEMSTCFIKRIGSLDDPQLIGFPIGVTAQVLCPETGCDLPLSGSSNVGELMVTGPVVASGYLNNENRTKNTFLSNSTGLVKSYKTGDLVERRIDGSFRFLGRRDTLVKIRGLRVELNEIEKALTSHSLVKTAIAIYPKQGIHNEKLSAVIQLEENVNMLSKQSNIRLKCDVQNILRDHLRRALPKYMIPQTWTFLATMPLTSSGKLDRVSILDTIESKSFPLLNGTNESQPFSSTTNCNSTTRASPNGPTPSYREDVALKTSFVDLGLDSVNLIGLRKILKKAYSLDLDIAHLGMLTLQNIIDEIAVRNGSSEDINQGYQSQDESLTDTFSRFILALQVRRQVADATEDYNPVECHSSFEPTKELSVLLTGATGFVGSYLIKTLLNALPIGHKIIALIRASSPQEGMQRLKNSCEQAKINLPPDIADLVEVWPGDLSKCDLGLDPRNIARLKGVVKDSIDVVIHNGANVNWTQSYKSLEASNVTSTLTLLGLLLSRPRPATFTYVSGGRALEIATAPNMRDFKINYLHQMKQRNDVGEKRPNNDNFAISALKSIVQAIDDLKLSLVGYDITKLVSEALTLAAPHLRKEARYQEQARNAFTTCIIRPGYIIGSSSHGFVNAEDYIWRVAATAVSLRKRCSESEESWLYLVGVDQVCQYMICNISPRKCIEDQKLMERNVLSGINVDRFWLIISEVFQINLEVIPSEDWLYLVGASIEKMDPSQHPLAPLFDAHCADRGILGLNRRNDHQDSDNAEIERCLRKSLTFLRDESSTFKQWIVEAQRRSV